MDAARKMLQAARMTSTLAETIGYYASSGEEEMAREQIRDLVNVKLASRGYPLPEECAGSPLLALGRSVLADFEEKLRLYGEPLCPADRAIHGFLKRYLGEEAAAFFGGDDLLVPSPSLVLERHGLARELSLPAGADHYDSGILSSWRVFQGVCHNPASDRRTTEGVFHVVDGGLPVPADKKTVPRGVFAGLLRAALNPPVELLRLPYTATLPEDRQAATFVSLLLRPVVCPEVPGAVRERTMEIRFFAPGSMVSNLDFVESIFGNAGDPFLPENDARLDAGGWTGHTGCVILAPHLTALRKRDLGLPHVSRATPRQIAEGMCWEDPDERYNGGASFKIACRDASGVCVTLIADSYYGYCKKEVKTQISYAANLSGGCGEEHAGGVLAFPSFDHGEDFTLNAAAGDVDHRWPEVVERLGDRMDVMPDGYGVDRTWPDIVYVPEDAHISLREQRITWTGPDGNPAGIKLLAGRTYVYPSGYKVEMVRNVKGQRWRLVGTQAEGTFCHKPCTVSGGGKSEISKPLDNAMLTGPVFVGNFEEDMRMAEEILARDFSGRFRNPREPQRPSRPILDPTRSFGSVVRLLTPSDQFTDAHNEWLRSVPRSVRDLVLVVKRRWKPSWGNDWRSRFSVDVIDGRPGNELKYRGQKLVTRYLRVGFAEGGAWRTFGIRKDFAPARKLQREDDITASVIVPAEALAGLHPGLSDPAYRFTANCEYRLFQRPDDAIIRGADAAAEADFSKSGMFFSNYEALPRTAAGEMMEDAIRFGQFTEPMQDLIRRVAAADRPDWFVCTAFPRLVDGRPTKNPRYLQNRHDLGPSREEYLAETGSRLYRRLSPGQPVLNPVHAVLPGRRNNPADPAAGIRPLAVYGPIHYQDLPELFMDYTASLTGKSPSTTGAGSEGALTKGPFNCLLPVHDLNQELIAMILTGRGAFSTAAGHIGRKYRVDHDISLIIPEVWSRMHLHERRPEWLIANGFLKRVEDFEYDGRMVPGSRLGWRITRDFVQRFFGRVFSDPAAVFPPDMLQPELQDRGEFADGIEYIAGAQQKAALACFQDGSIEFAIPPLKAILTIMAHGSWNGLKASDPEVRRLFDREEMLASDWYRARLEAKAAVDRSLWRRQAREIASFLANRTRLQPQERSEMEARLARARAEAAALEAPDAAGRYAGTTGLDPVLIPEEDVAVSGPAVQSAGLHR